MALLRGYLYIIADKSRQFAKIGMSRDVRSRFKALQSECPLELEVVDSHPCNYVKVRETRAHILLKELRLRNEWFRWDEPKIREAILQALAIPDETIREAMAKYTGSPEKYRRLMGMTVRPYNYPVKRLDTGEIYPNAKAAALAVFGTKEVAPKIKTAIRRRVKCGPCYWERM